MSKRYRSQDERVLQHILDHVDISQEYVSRTRARYGLLSLSASEFDTVLKRHGIETYYHDTTKGQQYKIVDIAIALKRLQDIFDKVQAAPFIFDTSTEPEQGGDGEKV